MQVLSQDSQLGGEGHGGARHRPQVLERRPPVQHRDVWAGGARGECQRPPEDIL